MHAPARGQSTGQQQMKNTSNTGGKLKTSLVAGGTLLGTVNTTAKTIANIESLNKTFHNITGNKGKTTEGHASAVKQPDDRVGIAEQEPGDNSLNVEDYEYADGELEGGDQELYYLPGDEEIADGLGVDDEDEDPYLPEDGSEQEEADYDYGGLEQEDEYACSERGVDDEGDQDANYPSEGGSGDGGVNYEDQEQEDQYDDSEPGDDGGDQEAYCPQDDGDGVDDDDGNGGIWTDLVDSLLNWSN